ncbi:hypothetical protein [Solimonas terrae]|uniref:Uncharacterized protein n=1 Tax=Solimonas terrae TaxID=1396819 RepID=A0A6M2BLA9_9GAMM|nr:hypothetical protein [Solimonas terrae]NGY03522.1 hypothetical protein [Solimonas terrae]
MRVRARPERVAGQRAIISAVLLVAFAPLASGATPAPAPQTSDPASPPDQADAPVPTVIVTPDDVFGESDHKLAKLLKSLPGADNAVPVRKSVGEKIGDYYDTHRSPNDLSADSQQRLSREVNGDPERQNLH